MRSIDQFEGHSGSSFYRIKGTAGGTESAVTAEGNILGVPALAAGIDSASQFWVATIDHSIDVFHLNISWMASEFDDLIMISENVL